MTGQRTSPRVLHPNTSASDASDQARMGAIWDGSCPKSRPCNSVGDGEGEGMGMGRGSGMGSGMGSGLWRDGSGDVVT